MKRLHYTALLASLLGALLWIGTASAQEAGKRLENIEVSTLPGDQVQIRLQLSGPAPEPVSFSINNPARVAIDLADTSLALPDRRKNIGIGAVQSVVTAEAKGRTRVVVNLAGMVPFDTRVSGNSVLVTLGASALAAGDPMPIASFGDTGAAAQQATPQAPARRAKAITNVDFRRGATGEGRVLVTLTDPKTAVDVSQQGGRILVDFINTEVAEDITQRYNVLDFATPVASFDVMKVEGGTRLVVTPAQGARYDQLAYQSDNLFALELKPLTLAEQEELERQKPEFTGERLTLNFQDIDTRAVLQIIADFTGLNVVVSDTVSGSVTLRLQNVPWDQALDIIMKAKGLDMRRTGNVIMVAPAAEIAAREKAELSTRQEIAELAPLETEFIQINYAKASDFAAIIQGAGRATSAAAPSGTTLTGMSGARGGGGSVGGKGSMLSERGTITVDERTNTLLVQDTADRLAEIRRLVERLDIPVRQVLIESRIVIATDDFERELGVRSGYTNFNVDPERISVVGGSVNSNTDLLNNLPAFVLPGNDRLNVNLPVGQPAGRIAFAILGSDYLVDLELSALQAEGKGQVVSSPRVVTANQKEAIIEQGVEIPYLEAASSGAATISFKEALLQLIVTPQITPDDRIIMDIQVRKDSVGAQVPVQGGSFVPSIDTRAILTQVLVNNGETVVLGGIYETTESNTVRKVPLLGDIPLLGSLFRTTRKVNNKAELLVFVTPRIVKEGMNVAQY